MVFATEACYSKSRFFVIYIIYTIYIKLFSSFVANLSLSQRWHVEAPVLINTWGNSHVPPVSYLPKVGGPDLPMHLRIVRWCVSRLPKCTRLSWPALKMSSGPSVPSRLTGISNGCFAVFHDADRIEGLKGLPYFSVARAIWHNSSAIVTLFNVYVNIWMKRLSSSERSVSMLQDRIRKSTSETIVPVKYKFNTLLFLRLFQLLFF